MLKFLQVRPPMRRVLALDSGSRRLKLLLAESDFGRLRILKEEMIDLQAEGLVSPEEVKTHLHSSLVNWGNPPLAFVLPEHLSTSQLIDLPLAPESEIDRLISEETVKLSGVSESRIIYDFVRTETTSQTRQQFWVTLSQEGEIRERILRLGLDHEDLCEVTTTANALIAAYQAACPLSSRTILVHLGAQSTVIVILLAGQGAFATSFQMGGDFFTRALARAQNCGEETAESLKRLHNFLSGPEAKGEFITAVDGWATELKRQLNEWFQHNPAAAAEVASFELIASGGGFDLAGLFAYLEQAGIAMRAWPTEGQTDTVVPSKGFEVAFGTALQALGHSAQPVSLLPEDYRQAWQKSLGRQRLEWASLGLAALCLLLLALGTWHTLSLISAKQTLKDKVEAAQKDVEAYLGLAGDLVNDYEHLRPILAAQQNTMDTLNTIALLQQSRSNRALWFVLLADKQSYLSQPPALLLTNRPAPTNAPAPIADLMHAPETWRAALGTSTNTSPRRPGLITELCIPGDPDAGIQMVNELVYGLKQQRLFYNADFLAHDLRRNLADPRVTLPDRDYTLKLDFAQTDFQQPVQKKLFPAPSRRSSGRNVREPSITGESDLRSGAFAPPQSTSSP